MVTVAVSGSQRMAGRDYIQRAKVLETRKTAAQRVAGSVIRKNGGNHLMGFHWTPGGLLEEGSVIQRKALLAIENVLPVDRGREVDLRRVDVHEG